MYIYVLGSSPQVLGNKSLLFAWSRCKQLSFGKVNTSITADEQRAQENLKGPREFVEDLGSFQTQSALLYDG